MKTIDSAEMEKLLTLYTSILGVIDSLEAEHNKLIEEKQDNIQRIQELDMELSTLKYIQDKINIGLKSLNEKEQLIIITKYFEGMTWKEIDNQLLINKQTSRRLKKRAIKKMCYVSRIDMESYQRVLEMLNQ